MACEDWYYSSIDQNGNEFFDWYWTDPNGEIVAYTDRQFQICVWSINESLQLRTVGNPDALRICSYCLF